MDKGKRFNLANDESRDVISGTSPLHTIVLYDRPVIFERAHQLLVGLSRTLDAGRAIQLTAWQFDTLERDWHGSQLRKLLGKAEMVVVAASADKALPESVELELRLWMELSAGKHRALLAFLEGSSPVAYQPSLPFDRLQTLANMHGADFFAHIADPAPYQAWPCLPDEDEAPKNRTMG